MGNDNVYNKYIPSGPVCSVWLGVLIGFYGPLNVMFVARSMEERRADEEEWSILPMNSVIAESDEDDGLLAGFGN